MSPDSTTQDRGSIPENADEFDSYIAWMRETEYPMLKDALYLDHAGTTLYSKSLMDSFHADMMGALLGNPHSASTSSQKSTMDVENVRLELLRFFRADPANFDVVFTANATAGIKLVMEGFREQVGGYWFGYHADSHTSVVGVREEARGHRCFESDDSVESWIDGEEVGEPSRLFAYPAQSNMNGRRLPLDWSGRLRYGASGGKVFTLLDASALVPTSPLDLSSAETAPDFTVLSLYKIFGFPDLGALIVRREAGHIFDRRRYFGGGTVDMVTCMSEQWHVSKSGPLHERLEDGTLPVHSIISVRSAFQAHRNLFGSMDRISQHTAHLSRRLHDGLSSMEHGNTNSVCAIYKYADSIYGDAATQGPTIAFNLLDSKGNWISSHELEKLATIKNIHIRTGGMCNPGGTASALHLAPWEMRENFSAGYRCGAENDLIKGKPTGLIRISLGAMSTKSDVDRFLAFMDEFFVDHAVLPPRTLSPLALSSIDQQRFHVESLHVYPIKSCGGWPVPDTMLWTIHQEGLDWDREWCLVHQGTGKALSQKQHPSMALIRPSLDFKAGVLRVVSPACIESISVPLSKDPSYFSGPAFTERDASVCGDAIKTRTYRSPTIADFFTKAIGVSCTLARFPAASGMKSASSRHSKPHLLEQAGGISRPILFSNESPILTISRSSLNRLNEQIKARGGKAAQPSVFRANIVLAENPFLPPGQEQPWAEDNWQGMRIGGREGPWLDFLGGCRRCQMVCIDQGSGEKNQEPFVTLAKTRRFDGKVYFGVHTSLLKTGGGQGSMVKAGDTVKTFGRDGNACT